MKGRGQWPFPAQKSLSIGNRAIVVAISPADFMPEGC